jgi:voltage-gated potassium channel
VPTAPEIITVIRDIITTTPFLPMFFTLVALWLVFSAGMYALEHGADGAVMKSYGEALWWGLASVETMGTPYEPVTVGGRVLGGIWAILGVMVFWGTIIASVSILLASRRKRSKERAIETIQYNFGELSDLSPEELEGLRYMANRVIDDQTEESKDTDRKTKRTRRLKG